MAKVTERRFAAFSVRVWRLVQRLEKLNAKMKTSPDYKVQSKRMDVRVKLRTVLNKLADNC